MKYLLILLLYTSTVLSDSFILSSEKMEDKGNTFWIITLCKDGFSYTIIKNEPLTYSTITQDFTSYQGKSFPLKCQYDFKSEEQLTK